MGSTRATEIAVDRVRPRRETKLGALKTMINKPLTWTALTLLATSAPSLLAQENERAIERLEVTMTLLPEQAQNAAQVIQRIIELPPPPVEQADANGRRPETLPGLENGRGEGLETAVEARERGRAFGQDVAAEARENRENVGRGGNAPGRPENLPGPPADLPAPPANPGRP